MSEAALASRFRKCVCKVGKGHYTRVENAVENGTPDVNLCVSSVDSWVELKHCEKWPAREKTPLRIPHFSKDQRLWLMMRAKAGGSVFVLLQVAREYMLFDGVWAAINLGEVDRSMLEEWSLVHCTGRFDDEAMLQVLRL